MEDILAITFIFGGGTLFLLAISPVGKAIAERIRGGGAHHLPGPDPEVLAELEALRADLTEVQERLDFTERLLAAQRRDPAALPGGDAA